MKAFVIAQWKVIAASAALFIIIGGGVLWHRAHVKSAGEAAEKIVREVAVVPVGELSGSTALPVVGTIRSQNEAQIRAESSGSITRLNYTLGDPVGAGQIIADIENSAQRAALLQAEGALEAAKASVPLLETSLDAAKSTSVNTLLSAYAAVGGSITDTADQMFSSPGTATAQFNITVSNSQAKVNVESIRLQLQPILKRQASVGPSLSVRSDLTTELATTEREVRQVRDFMDALTVALNSAISSPALSDTTIATYKANVSAARTLLTTSLSAIVSARASLETAQKNLAGSGSDGLSASHATLKQAQGSYNAALANLEKTIIRSPISGTINTLSINLGDFVAAFQQVAFVSNNGSLEAITYVTEEDRPSLSVGDEARIEKTIRGTIARIAPAIDPLNHKIEVRIAVPKEAVHITNGQSVQIELTRKNTSTISGPFSIPISALKMTSDAAFVFTLDDKNALVPHEVKTGPLSGDKIEIESGVTALMRIVVDARGLKEGDVVQVASSI